MRKSSGALALMNLLLALALLVLALAGAWTFAGRTPGCAVPLAISRAR